MALSATGPVECDAGTEGRDGPIRIPAFGRAFPLWASSMEDVQGTPERNAGPPASCCWRKAKNARRPSLSDASHRGGGFRIGPSLSFAVLGNRLSLVVRLAAGAQLPYAPGLACRLHPHRRLLRSLTRFLNGDAGFFDVLADALHRVAADR